MASRNVGTVVLNLQDALAFLENHPQAAAIAEVGNAILEDPMQLKKLERKTDCTIAPLFAAVYFLQFLDMTTLSYTALMEIRTDTYLKGQDYSDLSMLFYIGAWPFTRSDSLCILNTSRKYTDAKGSVGFLAAEFPTQYLAQHISRSSLYLIMQHVRHLPGMQYAIPYLEYSKIT